MNNNNLDKEVPVITLIAKRGTWKVFKELVPRSKTLNQAVVDLIQEYIQNNSIPATKQEIEDFNHPKKGDQRIGIL